MANFQKLLQDQKKKQDKDTVAISEAAQSYSLQIQKEKGLGQSFIKGEKDDDPISNAAVSVIQNFQGDLDSIADNDYTFLRDLIEKYNVFFKELPNSIDKERFTAKEGEYFEQVIKPVIRELAEIAGPILATKLAFRDLIKQFKPIKLAAATLGGIPIIGTAIQKKIERQEAGEETLRRAERAKGAETTREARKNIEDELSGFKPSTPAESLAEETSKDVKEIKRSVVTDREELFDDKKSTGQTAAAEEVAEEQAAVEEDRYNEQKSLWEMIAENTYESKELLEKLVQEEEGGLLDKVTGSGAMKTAGGAAAAGYGAKKLFGKKGTETAAKTAGKKVLGKTLLKSAIKKIPVIGAIAGIGFGLGRLMSGDVTGAALEVGSGLASTVPGVGTAASVAADAALAAKDIKNAENEIQQVSESSGVSAAEVVQPENMKDIVNIDSKRTIVRTTLETDGLENMLQKMSPNIPQAQTNINTGGNIIQNARTNTMLPDMTNKNIDTTIESLKNVY